MKPEEYKARRAEQDARYRSRTNSIPAIASDHVPSEHWARIEWMDLNTPVSTTIMNRLVDLENGSPTDQTIAMITKQYLYNNMPFSLPITDSESEALLEDKKSGGYLGYDDHKEAIQKYIDKQEKDTK